MHADAERELEKTIMATDAIDVEGKGGGAAAGKAAARRGSANSSSADGGGAGDASQKCSKCQKRLARRSECAKRRRFAFL